MNRLSSEFALSFDDILLKPSYSNILPKDVDLKTKLTKNISLNIPLLSAAMDKVTESNLAISLAKLGGVGVIHKNLSTEKQVAEVMKVKETKIIDLDYENFSQPCLDENNQLRVGAGVGIIDSNKERIISLIKSGVDFIVIDTAHGHSMKVIETVKWIRKNYDIEIIAGNIISGKAATDLVNAGADSVKVGIGVGSICTTRTVTGVGYPQISAILEVSSALKNSGIPLIADGGITSSGDLAKAIASGASSVMLGNFFAGSDESPGEMEIIDNKKYKSYRGMGSIGAMKEKFGSSDRYFQSNNDSKKLVPEGVEGMVLCKGTVKNLVYQILGGLRSSMGYLGCNNINEMMTRPEIVKMTNAGILKSEVYNLNKIKPSPNYFKKL